MSNYWIEGPEPGTRGRFAIRSRKDRDDAIAWTTNRVFAIRLIRLLEHDDRIQAFDMSIADGTMQKIVP